MSYDLTDASPKGQCHDTAPLRIVVSWGKSPIRGNLFAVDYQALCHGVDSAFERFARQGYNTLYVMPQPYRSPEGAVPWVADLTPEEDDFERALRAGKVEQLQEEACFAQVIAALRRNRLKAVFNAGVWLPQTWYRAHPEAISRLPDQTVQYDKNFQENQAQVFMPCFRSPEFLNYTRASIRTWLQTCTTLPGFEDVLCRVSISDTDGLRLTPGGAPLFIEHQDTHDRDWCHCERCVQAFREYLKQRLQKDATLDALGLAEADLETMRMPLSPGVPEPERFARDRLPETPAGRRLWFVASQFWTESVATWADTIRGTLREFYPEAELATVSKYTVCRPLTDYPRVARDNRVFLMDSYPMELGRNWNLTSYLFDVEVYQSAAAAAGQALVAHAQAYDNPRPGHVSQPPNPGQYLQQYIGCLARGVAAIVDFAMDHAVDLCSPEDATAMLPATEVDCVVAERQTTVSQLEEIFRHTRPYEGAVLLRYHRPSLCGTGEVTGDKKDGFPGALPSLADCLLAEYRAWKGRGVPVRMVWDDSSAEPTLPARHEIMLQGEHVADIDLYVRQGEDRYVVTLINLRSETRRAEILIALEGENMGHWRAQSVAGATLTAAASLQGLRVTCDLAALAWSVFEVHADTPCPKGDFTCQH